jgi:hypothetical protein
MMIEEGCAIWSDEVDQPLSIPFPIRLLLPVVAGLIELGFRPTNFKMALLLV